MCVVNFHSSLILPRPILAFFSMRVQAGPSFREVLKVWGIALALRIFAIMNIDFSNNGLIYFCWLLVTDDEIPLETGSKLAIKFFGTGLCYISSNHPANHNFSLRGCTDRLSISIHCDCTPLLSKPFSKFLKYKLALVRNGVSLGIENKCCYIFSGDFMIRNIPNNNLSSEKTYYSNLTVCVLL